MIPTLKGQAEVHRGEWRTFQVGSAPWHRTSGEIVIFAGDHIKLRRMETGEEIWLSVKYLEIWDVW